jgi:hypothetical protein
MSHHLDCGYTVRRVPGPHLVNGCPVGYLTDPVDRQIIVTDDGDADALVERTADAVMEAVALARKVQGQPAPDGIEVLTGKLPKCPLVPGTQPPSLFSQRPEA